MSEFIKIMNLNYYFSSRHVGITLLSSSSQYISELSINLDTLFQY